MFTSHLVALAFVFVFAVVNVVALPVPGAANVRLGVGRHRFGYLVIC